MRTIILVTASVVLVYSTVVWFTGSLLSLQGMQLWLLRSALWLIGLLAAAAVVWFFWKQRRAEAAEEESVEAISGTDEIGLLIREAEKRLSSSRVGKTGGIGSMPVFLIAGGPASAKTSIMMNSGLDPEFLAGRVHQDNQIAPTQSANVWYAKGAVFVEAGGLLLKDQGLWAQLVRRLRPGRFGSVVRGAQQAPRAVLVCFDAETFMQAGGTESAAAAARELRQRLGTLCEKYGINLPVYALFTRMDRVPFFQEYVRNLSNDEAAQVLGVTLPFAAGDRKGIYAEQETARLSAAFDDLFRSLCRHRPDFLSREHDPATLPGVYEFPREFRKLRNPLVQYLVDLCRPSQLAVSPFLRGFYFSGVRPVIVSEVVAAPAPVRPQAAQGVTDATGIFRQGMAEQQPQTQPRVTGSRKVPQWTFLGRLFHNVLLEDSIAMGASGSSTQASFLRRAGFLALSVLCLALSVAFIVSYARNRALETEVAEAARAISAAPPVGSDLPSADSLTRLETLRQSLERLGTYRKEGAPWSLRWGLYTGDDLYPHVRRLYFDHFHQLLFGQTQTSLLAYMRNLPFTPGPEYGPTYDTLKAYLITTSHHDKSTRDFLAPALIRTWAAGRTIDPARLSLAEKQFAFYSEELKQANPFSSDNDSASIEKTRRYLAQFAGFERVYRAMLTDAARSGPPILFNRKFPGSEAAVIDSYEVSPAFTKTGWDFMTGAMKNPDKYFSGEQWVLGQQVSANIDRGKLVQELKQRYHDDFIREWRMFIRSATVLRYANLQDASKKLGLMSGNQSPLLALIWLASQNTNVGTEPIMSAFQPVQSVVPPASVDRYIAAPNQAYMGALMALQTSLESAAALPQVNDAVAAQVLTNASTAKLAARQLAQGFRVDSEAHLETQVQKLLEDPITYLEGLLRALGPAELNGKGKSLCSQMRTVWNKYPFNAASPTDATVDEVNGLLRKPDGALWSFYDTSLQKILVKQGAQYVAAPGSGMTLNPAFVSFFNQAASLSEAFYPGGAQDPRLSYTLKPVQSEGIQSVGLKLDGQAAMFSAGDSSPKKFLWQSGGLHEAKATVKFGGGPDLTWSSNEGLWAVFRLFSKAEQLQPSGNGFIAEWIIRIGKDPVALPGGKPLTVRFELNMEPAPPLFQRGYLSRLGCVVEVAR
jgi:type VI secretion system protein ImpL